MIDREDFYSINKKTLENFYGNNRSGVKTILYIYPKINAIVTKKPNSAVKKYLLTEFSVRSPIKRILAKLYVRFCLASRGKMADMTVDVYAHIKDSVLIFPCNKKYRIFDFEKNCVTVIPKFGFSDKDLRQEILFRSRRNIPVFVPNISKLLVSGYVEEIIDGIPLARITNSGRFEYYRKNAYEMLYAFALKTFKKIAVKEYLNELILSVKSKLNAKKTDLIKIESTFMKIADIASTFDSVEIGFSHGDLQPGNIWIENETERIIIIDWESWGYRSIWYDNAVLFDSLRPGGIDDYLKKPIDTFRKAIVLLEDAVFHIDEFNSLPSSVGEKALNDYFDKLDSWLQEVNRA